MSENCVLYAAYTYHPQVTQLVAAANTRAYMLHVVHREDRIATLSYSHQSLETE